MKIKVREITKGCMPEVIKVGDWIDLRAACDYQMKGPYAKMLSRKKETGRCRKLVFDDGKIPLGVAIQLPKGLEAVVIPRSSTFSRYGIVCANSEGLIDNSYCGNNDQWHFPVIAFRDCLIEKGERICQFRIQLSQKATVWQKLKWLFTSKIEFEKVDRLDNPDRGGFGEGTKDIA